MFAKRPCFALLIFNGRIGLGVPQSLPLFELYGLDWEVFRCLCILPTTMSPSFRFLANFQLYFHYINNKNQNTLIGKTNGDVHNICIFTFLKLFLLLNCTQFSKIWHNWHLSLNAWNINHTFIKFIYFLFYPSHNITLIIYPFNIYKLTKTTILKFKLWATKNKKKSSFNIHQKFKI